MDKERLDRIDVKILASLQRDAHLTNIMLADAVGLSPSPCLQRVKRLEKAGYIESYRARLRVSKLLEAVTVFTEMTLSDHRREDFVKFERGIRQCPFVEECHLISGGYDYLVKFTARSVSHYQEVIEAILERNIGVKKYFSYIVIKTILDNRLRVDLHPIDRRRLNSQVTAKPFFSGRYFGISCWARRSFEVKCCGSERTLSTSPRAAGSE